MAFSEGNGRTQHEGDHVCVKAETAQQPESVGVEPEGVPSLRHDEGYGAEDGPSDGQQCDQRCTRHRGDVRHSTARALDRSQRLA